MLKCNYVISLFALYTKDCRFQHIFTNRLWTVLMCTQYSFIHFRINYFIDHQISWKNKNDVKVNRRVSLSFDEILFIGQKFHVNLWAPPLRSANWHYIFCVLNVKCKNTCVLPSLSSYISLPSGAEIQYVNILCELLNSYT